jgi:phosphoribosylglycinamide formyltransferase-1
VIAMQKKRVAVLISGRGSNMMSLVEAAKAPDYPAEIVVVISNRPDAAGLAWAKAQGIPALGLDHKRYESREHFEGQLQSVLEASKVDLVACAGFMRLMTPAFVDKWRDRMLNVHPSLLPAFKGLDTHRRALEAGVKIAGCTVHLVRPEMDEGPILAQAAVPVLEGDTEEMLAARILRQEHRIYPIALRWVAAGQVRVSGNRVGFGKPSPEPAPLVAPALES